MSEETKPPPTEFPERSEPFNLGAYDCPRCGKNTSAEHYGPCESCVATLRVSQKGDGSAADGAAAYEPKMNVTPNAVALKDD